LVRWGFERGFNYSGKALHPEFQIFLRKFGTLDIFLLSIFGKLFLILVQATETMNLLPMILVFFIPVVKYG
jgi:hypothetical protein